MKKRTILKLIMNNRTLDDGGFDLDREREAATERMMARLEQLDTDLMAAAAQRNNGGGGPTSTDIYDDEFRALEQRARDHQYQYPTRSTCEAA